MKRIKRMKLENRALFVIGLSLFMVVLSWASALYVYPSLPGTVPTHYGIAGTPDAYGSKSTLLIVPLVFTIIAVLMALILRFRYTLIEKYPYVINLPAFVYQLGNQKDSDKAGRIMNKVFSVFSISLLFISFLDAAMTYLMFFSSGNQSIVGVLLPLILVSVLIFVILVFALYRTIYREIVRELR